MTVNDIKALVAGVDPQAGHYFSAYAGSEAYTVWNELQLLPFLADDGHEEGWHFQIDRFTKSEEDAIVPALDAALRAHPGIAYAHLVDPEPDTGYIHHIFDCEGY